MGLCQRPSVVGSAWWLTTVFVSTYCSGAFLNYFGSPSLLTAVRFAGSSVLGLSLDACSSSRLGLHGLARLVPALAVPSAFLLSANFFNSVAMGASGITLPYVLKSAIPLFTVAICRTVLKETYTAAVYLSLVPTVAGVAVASMADTECNALGLTASILSSLCQTGLNLTSKPCIRRAGISGVQAQMVMASSSAVVMVPLTLIVGGGEAHDAPTSFGVFLLVLTAVAYHMEYSLNFVMVTLVQPLTFSIVDITRRLGIIVCGAIFFSKTLTAFNEAGIAVALTGVAAFTIAEHRRKKDRLFKRAAPLEAVHVDTLPGESPQPER